MTKWEKGPSGINPRFFRVEICGGIAAGKTTLAKRLSETAGILLGREKFTQVPFWRECYHSYGQKYLLEKNIGFLLFHAHCIKRVTTSGRGSVCDFSFFQDLAYADLCRDLDEIRIVDSVFWRFVEHLPPPAVVIDLSCSPKTQLERIRQRGRKPEMTINEHFLLQLRIAIDTRRQQFELDHRVPFIAADSDKSDFLHDTQEVQTLWEKVRTQINNL
jgi:deoxyadenosine/deoxycytidine kinase